MMKRWLLGLATVAILAVVLEPVFFTIVRLMVFNTVPRDDYAPFLLWLTGAPGGAFPGSPYGYRILSVVAAAPFYYALPGLHLTNLPPALAAPYVRATTAIAGLEYVSLLAAGVVAYRTARDRVLLPRREAVLAGAMLALSILYSQFFAIDAFAILLVATCVYLLPRPLGFAALVLPATFANEKVIIVLAMWLTLRCMTSAADRRRFGAQWLTALAAAALYVGALRFLHFPGNAYQLEPAGYLATLWTNVEASVSVRGLFLNVLPVVVMLTAAALGWRHAGSQRFDGLFRPIDLLVIPGLVVVALVLTQFFQTGRIVAHAAPLFVIPVAAAIGRWMDGGSAVRADRSPGVDRP